MQPILQKAVFFDIFSILRLVRTCSNADYFNPAYTRPNCQFKLALQLFSILLFGKIPLANNIWQRAQLNVVRVADTDNFVGFTLVRYLDAQGLTREIYMFAIKSSCRGQGYGHFMLNSILANLPANTLIKALCRPKATEMQQLLHKLGFKSAKHKHINAVTAFRLALSDFDNDHS